MVAALDTRDLAALTEPTTTPERAGTVPLSLRVNAREHRLRIDPRTTLLDCLRETLLSPERKRVATTGNAAPARCM